MKSTKAATRYAKSLLEIATEQNSVDAVRNDMKFVIDTCKENSEFQTFLKSPIIPTEKKRSVFELVFANFQPVSKNFVDLIAKNNREDLLQEIGQSFIDQLNEKSGIVLVSIVTAAPLNEATRSKILAQVQTVTPGTLEVTETIDKNLIGGFVVRMGDYRIDASVANQLAQLKQKLVHN